MFAKFYYNLIKEIIFLVELYYGRKQYIKPNHWIFLWKVDDSPIKNGKYCFKLIKITIIHKTLEMSKLRLQMSKKIKEFNFIKKIISQRR